MYAGQNEMKAVVLCDLWSDLCDLDHKNLIQFTEMSLIWPYYASVCCCFSLLQVADPAQTKLYYITWNNKVTFTNGGQFLLGSHITLVLNFSEFSKISILIVAKLTYLYVFSQFTFGLLLLPFFMAFIDVFF